MERWSFEKQSVMHVFGISQRRKSAKENSIFPTPQLSNIPSLHHSISPIIQTIFFAFLLLSLASCQTKTDKLRVSRVDSISFRMEETAKVYFKIDTIKIDSLYNTVLVNLDKLNQLVINDDKKLLMNYGTLKKGFKEFIKRRPYTLEELEFCRKQIENLREDAESGLLTDEEFELFLKHEANASQSLRVQMSYYQARIAAQVNKFERLNPQIDSLINSLNQ